MSEEPPTKKKKPGVTANDYDSYPPQPGGDDQTLCHYYHKYYQRECFLTNLTDGKRSHWTTLSTMMLNRLGVLLTHDWLKTNGPWIHEKMSEKNEEGNLVYDPSRYDEESIKTIIWATYPQCSNLHKGVTPATPGAPAEPDVRSLHKPKSKKSTSSSLPAMSLSQPSMVDGDEDKESVTTAQPVTKTVETQQGLSLTYSRKRNDHLENIGLQLQVTNKYLSRLFRHLTSTGGIRNSMSIAQAQAKIDQRMEEKDGSGSESDVEVKEQPKKNGAKGAPKKSLSTSSLSDEVTDHEKEREKKKKKKKNGE